MQELIITMDKKPTRIQLSTRKMRFVDEYINNGMNATKAYMSIYKAKSEVSAATHGSALVRSPAVKAHLDQKLSQIAEQCQIKTEYLVATLQEVIKRCLDTNTGLMTAVKAVQTLAHLGGLNKQVTQSANDNQVAIKIDLNSIVPDNQAIQMIEISGSTSQPSQPNLPTQ